MISEFTIEDFTRYIVRQLEELGNVTLSNPDVEEEFPLRVVSNPMQYIVITEDNVPVKIRFSIYVESWANSKYEVMQMFQETNKKLRNSNIAQLGGNNDMYDAITKKYRFGGQYEVFYNGLTNSFERII